MARVNEYIARCAAEEIGGKRTGRFPNLAGFCRDIGMGLDAFGRAMDAYPETYGLLCAIFEDEALNSPLSGTVVSAYLKRRLGYGDKGAEERTLCETPELSISFDHDIFEDGG